MDAIREQMALSNEISEAISNPVGMGHELDEDALRDELQELEQAELHGRLGGADPAPVHTLPAAATTRPQPAYTAPADADEDAELRALQAELAM